MNNTENSQLPGDSPVRFSDLVRRRLENNEAVLEKCVAIMREHDKRAEMANFARCGCEFCKIVRHYEPPNKDYPTAG